MANWIDKISKAASEVGKNLTEAASTITKTYNEKGLDGIVEKTEGVFSKVTQKADKVSDKASDYFKEIGKSNREVMKEVEEKVGDGSIKSKVAVGLAATANTTQTIAEDLIQFGKQKLNEFSKEEKSATPTTSTQKVDSISLETVLKEVMYATKKEASGQWATVDNKETYIIKDNKWYNVNKQEGGVGAISLTAHHLSTITKQDYTAQLAELKKEATNLLQVRYTPQVTAENEKAAVRKYSETAPVKKTATKTATKTVVKAPAKKVAAVLQKNEKEAVLKYSADVPKKVAKKVATKTPAKKAVTSKVATKKVATKKVASAPVESEVKTTKRPKP